MLATCLSFHVCCEVMFVVQSTLFCSLRDYFFFPELWKLWSISSERYQAKETVKNHALSSENCRHLVFFSRDNCYIPNWLCLYFRTKLNKLFLLSNIFQKQLFICTQGSNFKAVFWLNSACKIVSNQYYTWTNPDIFSLDMT